MPTPPLATHLAALVQDAPLAMAIFDANGQLVLTNAAFEALAPEPDRAAIAAALLGTTTTKASARRDGEVALEARWGPLRDADGAITHVACWVKDITANVRANRLDAVVESTAVPIVIGNELGIIYANHAARSLFMAGLPVEAQTQLMRYPRRHLDGRPYTIDELPFVRVLRGDVVVGDESLIDLPDGTTRRIIVNAAPLPTEPGQLREGVASLFDVTTMRRHEAELRHVFHSNMLGIIAYQSDGTITDANDAFLAIVGYDRDDVAAGRVQWRHLTPPEHAYKDTRALQEIAARGRCTPFEKEYIRLDGSRVPIVLGAASFPHAPDRGIAFVLDVSERRALEEQVRRSQKLEAIGRLAGGIAHDFNNMLTGILGFATLVDDALPAGDPKKLDVGEIIRAAERAGNLVRQLLTFSRRDASEARVVDLGAQVQSLENMLQRVIGDAIVLETRLSAGAVPVLVDPTQLEQVLLNLVVNARDAMPGGGRLVVETTEASPDELEELGSTPSLAHAVLSVSDTGVGMGPEVRERIFEPFYSTKGGLGSGLGLSTVFGIVKGADGHIRVQSEPGRGSSFRIYLPIAQSADGSVSPRAARPERPNASGSPGVGGTVGGRETILLVEDDPIVRHLASRILARSGYRVLEAANAGEALLVADQHDGVIDLLLTDVAMPRMSGRVLAERLMRERPGLPVVYMSGEVRDEVAQREHWFVVKPLKPDPLLRTVRQALDHRAQPSVDQRTRTRS